jgi:hypothetical protein
MDKKEMELKLQPHEWRGAWNRPMKISELGQHPFTVARMTDHNVRGRDPDEPTEHEEVESLYSVVIEH